MTDALVAFLKARLDEDEAAAEAAASVAGPGWKAETYWPEDESRTRTCVRSEGGAFLADFDDTPDYPDLATHVALHDPARELREVLFWRKVLDAYSDSLEGSIVRDAIGFTVIAYAAVYSDHPDYWQEWAP